MKRLLLLGTVSFFIASGLSTVVAGAAEPRNHACVGGTVSALATTMPRGEFGQTIRVFAQLPRLPVVELPGIGDGNQSLQAGPSGGGGGGRQPLGVPPGYEAPVPRSLLGGYYPHGYSYKTDRYGAGALDAAHEIVGVAPRYFQGDEWKPAAMSPEAIATEQRKLLDAGFVSPSDTIRLGFWDEPTRKAYAQALSAANASGRDYDATLTAAANAVPFGPDQSHQAGR